MDFWFSERHTPDVKISLKVKKQLYSKKSDYQKIDVFDTYEFGKVLALKILELNKQYIKI